MIMFLQRNLIWRTESQHKQSIFWNEVCSYLCYCVTCVLLLLIIIRLTIFCLVFRPAVEKIAHGNNILYLSTIITSLLILLVLLLLYYYYYYYYYLLFTYYLYFFIIIFSNTHKYLLYYMIYYVYREICEYIYSIYIYSVVSCYTTCDHVTMW